jgi:hypothetical protein
LTFLNRGQYYKLQLETELVGSQTTLISLDFSLPAHQSNARQLWKFMTTTLGDSGIPASVLTAQSDNVRIRQTAWNQVEVVWLERCSVEIAVHCLSTDFSLTKGIKGASFVFIFLT